MTKGTLIAAMKLGRAAEDEFHDWYDTEHLPERQRVPGFLLCQRWIGAQDRTVSVATYDLESVAILTMPAYLAIGGDNLSPWSKRITARVERLMRFEGDQILPGDVLPPANAGGLLLNAMNIAPDLEAGNMLAKSLSFLADADAAGIVLGARDRLPDRVPAPDRVLTAANPAWRCSLRASPGAGAASRSRSSSTFP